MRKVAHPLGLHGDGLHARSQFGELIAPWETIQSAAIERAWNGKRLRIRLVPPGDPTRTPGSSRHAESAGARRSSTSAGCATRCASSTSALDELRQAFVVQSGGRVRVS